MFKYLQGNTMKNYKLITLTTATILFFLSGCGGTDATIQELQDTGKTVVEQEDNQTKKSDSDIVLEFKTEGAYDLNDYLFPSSTLAQKRFFVKTYTEDTDLTDTVYGIQTDTSSYKQTYEIAGNQITYKEDGKFDTLYTLLNDRIQREDDTRSASVDIVRFPDMGSYISSAEERLSLYGINTTTNLNIQCKLNATLESKNNYTDIIQVVCQSQNRLYRGEYFYAKEIGSILEINSLCTQNASSELNCTNIVSEYRPLS